MSLMISKGSGALVIPPAAIGEHNAVCCEVYDRGMQDTKFGKKRQIWIVWQVEERIEGTGNPDFDGKRKEIRRLYNWTLGEDSNLLNDLESWRGEAFTDDDYDENDQFDITKVEGAQATLKIAEWSKPDKNGRQYANLPKIGGVLPANYLKTLPPNTMEAEDYVLLDQRQNTDFPPSDEQGSAAGGTQAQTKAGGKTKRDMPF